MLRTPPTVASVMRKRLAPLGTLVPKRSSVRSSGATRWRTCSVANGCARIAVSASSARRVTTSAPAGSLAAQARESASAAIRSGATSTGFGSAAGAASPMVTSKPKETSKNRIENDARPWACHGRGPLRVSARLIESRVCPPALTASLAAMSTTNASGDNVTSASKDMKPPMLKLPARAPTSRRAPNCTVFEVSAR